MSALFRRSLSGQIFLQGEYFLSLTACEDRVDVSLQSRMAAEMDRVGGPPGSPARWRFCQRAGVGRVGA